MTTEQIVKNLVRVGKVSDVNVDDRECRVIYEDTGITSGWLKVLDNHPYVHVMMSFKGSEFARSAAYDTIDRELGYSGETFSKDDIPDTVDLTKTYGYDMLCSECTAGTETAAHEAYFEIWPWLPKINQKVLVLYLPVFNADGFVLGGVTT